MFAPARRSLPFASRPRQVLARWRDVTRRAHGPAWWVPTGSMRQARRGHAAAAMADGTVLVCGGSTGPVGVEDSTATTELYRPARGLWGEVAAMACDRTHHTATVLADGTVLAVGGRSDRGSATVLATAERFDPARLGWAPTGAMAVERVGHAATLLRDGRVLVAGGRDVGGEPMRSAEVYDPGCGGWEWAGAMTAGRVGASATLLADGRVLVAGGHRPGRPGGHTSCDIYDPRSGRWSPTRGLGLPRDHEETGGHRTVRLADGRVLAFGGYDPAAGRYRRSCEVYDPARGRWSPTAPMRWARGAGVGVLLGDGSVVVAGGYDDERGALGLAERYDPRHDQWRPLPPMLADRGGFLTLVVLGRRLLLAAGGDGPPPDFLPLPSAELLML